MKMKNLSLAIALVALSTINHQFSTALAQGTAFTYQGRLSDNGAPANGSYDFEFALFDTPKGLAHLFKTPPEVTNLAVNVSNGLFTTTIDFGSTYGDLGILFNGRDYWLDIYVSTNGANNFTELNPRQPITFAPYALFANMASNVSGTISASQLSGTMATTNLSGTISQANLGATNSYAPVIGNGSANFTMSQQSGYYTKMGNLVYFEAWLEWSDTNSVGSGSLQVSLPFPVASPRAVFNIGYVNGVTFSHQLVPIASAGTSNITFFDLSAGKSANTYAVPVSNCGNSGEIQITGTYRWQ